MMSSGVANSTTATTWLPTADVVGRANITAACCELGLPDVAALSELGLVGFESVGWFGLVAPAGTPPDIIGRLNAAFVKALSDPAAIEKIRVLGAEPAPSSADAFAQFIRSESAKWGKLIGDAGIKSE